MTWLANCIIEACAILLMGFTVMAAIWVGARIAYRKRK